MNEKTVISAATLTGTLLGYYLSKEKHRIPLLLIGGFVGTLVGEVVVRQREQRKLAKNNGKGF